MVSIRSGPGTPKVTALTAYSLCKWGEYFGWMAPWDLNPEWHFHKYILSGSKPTYEQFWGPCGWMWPAMYGVLLGPGEASSCGGGAALRKLLAQRPALLVPGVRPVLAGAHGRRVLLQKFPSPPCRLCVCLAELAVEPRSISRPHGTWWQLSLCDENAPVVRWRPGGGGLSGRGGWHISWPGSGRDGTRTGVPGL
jgi:hypothetical protein